MKRVLMVITKGEIGGAQEVVLQLARGLRDRGYAISVGFGAGAGVYLSGELAREGIASVQFKHLRRTRNPFVNFLFEREMASFLKKNSFDVVHMHSSNALIAARAAKHVSSSIKTIFTFHGMSFVAQTHGSFLQRYFYTRLFKRLLRWVDVPVTVCEADRRRGRELGLFQKATVIPIGIFDPPFRLREDARRVLEDKIRVETGVGAQLEGRIILGALGRLAYPKNYEFLIAAMPVLVSRYPKVACIIIGGGPERKKYERLIRSLHMEGSVFLAGESAHGAQYLKAFDVFVLTSLYEGMPVTLLEAMRAGIAALAPIVGGIEEVLQESRQQLFISKDRAEFEEKAGALLGDVEMRQRLGQWNMGRSKLFSVERMVAGYESII